MSSRYQDKNKRVKNVDELKLINDTQVLIMQEDQFYSEVVVELGAMSDRFEELKPLIMYVAENLYKMDEIAQKYSKEPRFAYEYEVSTIYIDTPDRIRLEYYGITENTEFFVGFQLEDNELILKSFGMRDNIPRDWDK